ncbi:MAG: polyhydroxyalkanoate synthesis regulator DNA-binding domain-containing protein [Candidatus Zixiibacteriota bacterium]
MQNRVIKRYKNRRLYDTVDKKTIKLEDVARLVKDDSGFKVIDNQTGKDVTLSVLGRVFSDTFSENKKNLKQTTKLIRSLISRGGVMTKDFFERSILFGLGLFDLTKEKAEKIVDEMIQRGEMSQSDKAKAVRELLKGHEERINKFKEKVDQRVGEIAAKVRGKEREELSQLHKKLDELTKVVERLEKKLGEK